MLLKRKGAGGVTFSRDPLNLTNIHNRKYEGFVDTKVRFYHRFSTSPSVYCSLIVSCIIPLLLTHLLGNWRKPVASESLCLNPHHEKSRRRRCIWYSFPSIQAPQNPPLPRQHT